MVLLLRRLPTTHFARALNGGVRDPHSVLGLPINSGREAIRRRYFELAKTTHPDTRSAAADGTAAEDSSNGPGDPSGDFVELHAAFESLMRSAASSTPSSEKGSSSAASTSARGGGGQWARKGAARARPFEPRTVSLAEVLALRLEEEPDELDAVWAEIVSRGLEVGKGLAAAALHKKLRSGTRGRSIKVHLSAEPPPPHPFPPFVNPPLYLPLSGGCPSSRRLVPRMFTVVLAARLHGRGVAAAERSEREGAALRRPSLCRARLPAHLVCAGASPRARAAEFEGRASGEGRGRPEAPHAREPRAPLFKQGRGYPPTPRMI